MLEATAKHPRDDATLSYIFLKDAGKLKKINFGDIVYIKAEQEYSSIVMTNSKVLASKHLKLLIDVLPKQLFTRIHRSYIVSHHKIVAISGNKVQMEDGTELPIGSTYKEKLIDRLNI